MRSLKFPNMNELGISVKSILWENDFKRIVDFANYDNKIVIKKIFEWNKEKEKVDKEELLFYCKRVLKLWYENYKREKQVKEIWESKGYKVRVTNDWEDAVKGVDLIAYRPGTTQLYFIQVKPNEKTLNHWDYRTFFNYSQEKKASAICFYLDEAGQWRVRTIEKNKQQ